MGLRVTWQMPRGQGSTALGPGRLAAICLNTDHALKSNRGPDTIKPTESEVT